MSTKSKVLVKFVLFVLLLDFSQAFASPTYYDQSTAGSQSVTIDQPFKPKLSGNSGGLEYSYTFKIPKGRSDLTPDLAITYNSQNESNQNFVGYGFSLSVPYIQRLNTKGVENLYTQNDFTSNKYGDLVKSTSTNFFYAKNNDATLADFYQVGQTWEVNDNKGFKYIYGGDTTALVQNASNTAEIYTWYLTDITDPSGNNIHYTYTKDNGMVYPSSITYTNNTSGVSGVYELRFSWEGRNDQLESYQSGFLVKNTKRLASLDVYVAGARRKTFALRYIPGVNGVRSMLAGVTETGYDENGLGKALPETVFTYSQPQTESKTVSVGGDFDRIVDVNGDGLLDFVFSRNYAGLDSYGNFRSNKIVYLNKGDNTFQAVTLIDKTTNCAPNAQPICVPVDQVSPTELPFYLSYSVSGSINPNQAYLADLDGDGYVDAVGPYTNWKGNPTKTITTVSTSTVTNGTSTQVITSTTTQTLSATSTLFFTSTPNFAFPNNNFGINTKGIDQINADGDKIPDYMVSTGNYNVLYTLNDASQFVQSGSVLQSYLSKSGDSQSDPKFYAYMYIDVNGDGLDDLVQVYSTWYQAQPRTEYKNVWINTGKSLVQITSTTTLANYNLPRSFEYGSYYNSYSTNFYVDTNFDGLVDAVTMGGGSAVGTGLGFSGTFTYGNGALPSVANSFAADLNGDGLPDLATPINSSNSQFQVAMSKMKADLLVNIKNSQGGESSFEYTPAVSYKRVENGVTVQANKIAYPMWTLKTETTKDGLGGQSLRSYAYEDGYVSRPNRQDTKFTGFGKIITTEANGLKTIAYYHQGNENTQDEVNDSLNKLGKVYKQEVYDGNNVLLRKDLFEYTEIPSLYSASSTNAVLTKVLSQQVDTLSQNQFTTAKSFLYDTNLNLATTTDFGDVVGTSTLQFSPTSTSSIRVMSVVYGSSSVKPKWYLPVIKMLTDATGTVFSREDYYYDGNTNTSITYGRLTQKDSYVDQNTKQSEKTTYDSQYGIPLTTVDVRGATTTFVYDNYKLYPTQITNALNQNSYPVYDYVVGKIKQLTDPNNLVTKTDFDSFGRTLKTYRNGQVVNEYIYNDTYLPDVTVKKYDSDSTSTVSVLYFDGQGQVVKTKTELPGGNYSTIDKYYDGLGNLIKESIPYVTSVLGRYDSVTLQDYYFKLYTYDVLNRVTEVKTALGSDKALYQPRSKVVFDKNNHQTSFGYDKDGLVTTVNETNNSSVYTTTYVYDLLGNLVRINDAENGIRSIKYDFLGRKVADELTHIVATSTGWRQFTYGKNNEFAEVVYADGSKTRTDYDLLGRKLQEGGTIFFATTTFVTVGTTTVATTTLASSTVIVTSFVYDSCANGIGKLCIASSSDGVVKRYTYDANGDPVVITTGVTNQYWSPNGTSTYSYDRQGNVITDGDGTATFTKIYTKSYPQLVTYSDSNASTTLFTNATYNAFGKVLSYDRGALRTQNTYDEKMLGRIANFSLLKFGQNSYVFATTSPIALPANNATTTQDISAKGSIYAENPIYANRSSSGSVDAGYIYPVSGPNYLSIASQRSSSTASRFDSIEGISVQRVALSSTTTAGYLELFVKDKTLQMNDGLAYVQLFKRNASPYLSTGIYSECSTSTPYSSPVMITSIATGTYLQLPLNTQFFNDYMLKNQGDYVALCLMEGHTAFGSSTIATTTAKTNSLTISHDYYMYPAPSDWTTKFMGYYTYFYSAKNTKPAISSITPTSGGQGLNPKLTINFSDANGHTLSQAETYFRLAGATTSPYYVASTTVTSLSTSQIFQTLDTYPFAYGTSYELVTRVKDSAGDWSTYASSTYTTLNQNDGTNKVTCASVLNSSLGSVECPDPKFTVMIGYQDTAYAANAAQGYIPWDLRIMRVTITVGTSTNVASSSIGQFVSQELTDKAFNTPIDIVVASGTPIKLRANTKYYYTVTARYGWNMGSYIIEYTDQDRIIGPFIFTTGDFKTFQNSSYGYDSLGRIASILKDDDATLEKTLYTYDELSRLTQVAKNTPVYSTSTTVTESYTYSPAGKILTNGAKNYTYGGVLTQSPTQVGSEVLTYDLRGRLATSTVLGTFTWDALNRMKTKATGATTTQYLYDADGNRVLSLTFVQSGTTTVLRSKLFTPTQTIQNTGSTTSYLLNLLGKSLVVIDRTATTTTVGTSTVATTTTKIQSLITDHLGSIEKVLDFSTGATLSTSTYSAYGSLTKVGATNLNRGYTGHQMDTDLIYMNARYENPSSGQFLSPDDVTQALGDDVLTKAYTGNNTQSYLHNPQGLNTYAYTRNNPVMYTDPDGRCPVCLAGLIWLGSTEGIATIGAVTATLPYWTGQMADANQTMTDPNASGFDKTLAGLNYLPVVGGIAQDVGKGAQAVRFVSKNGDTIVEQGRFLGHIVKDHAWNSTRENLPASKFNKGEDILKLIMQSSGAKQKLQNGTGNFERIIDAGRNIGIDIKTGQQTSIYTVIVNKANKVITSFPGTPK